MSDDLIARLREMARSLYDECAKGNVPAPFGSSIPDRLMAAADEIERLRALIDSERDAPTIAYLAGAHDSKAECERLRAAIKPWAGAYAIAIKPFEGKHPDDFGVCPLLPTAWPTIADLRALAALAPKP